MNINNAPKHMQMAWLERRFLELLADAKNWGFEVHVSPLNKTEVIVKEIDRTPTRRIYSDD